MLTEQEIIKLQQGEYFTKKNLIGKGIGGRVYYINKRYVVKTITSRFGIKKIDDKIFRSELETTILLSSFDISPRVVYHSSKDEKYRYFVMEKLSYTLYFMIKEKLLKEEYICKLEKTLKKLQKMGYEHDDLHFNNIMWSERLNDFRIIDWGYFTWHKEKSYIRKDKLIKRYRNVINRSRLYMTKTSISYFAIYIKIYGKKICNIAIGRW